MESDVVTLQDIFVAKPPDEDAPARTARASCSRRSSCDRAQAALPGEAGRERRRPAGELLRAGRERLPLHRRRSELPELRMRHRRSSSRRSLRRLPVRRLGERRRRAEGRRRERVPDRPRHRRHADADRQGPAARSRTASRSAPCSPRTSAVRRAWSSRSTARRSMEGKPFARRRGRCAGVPAGEAAQRSGRRGDVRHDAVLLTGFSTSPADARSALAALDVDPKEGTTLYDSLVQSAGRSAPSRTPAASSSQSPTATRRAAPRRSRTRSRSPASPASPSTWSRIESARFNPAPLKTLARATGGSYRGAGSSRRARRDLREHRRELQRTWRLEYPTAARPGERLKLTALDDGRERRSSRSRSRAADARPRRRTRWSRRASTRRARRPGAARRAARPVSPARSRSPPRVASGCASDSHRTSGRHAPRAKRKQERQRLASLRSLFRLTEEAFSHGSTWRTLQRMLERADLPLRTVEFVYLIGGGAVVFGLVAAAIAPSGFVILLATLVGGAAPLGFVWFKGNKRISAFEDQLPDLLITLAASLKAGHSFKQGLQSVVDEGREPASKEFKRVLTETRLGRPMDEALQDMACASARRTSTSSSRPSRIQRQVGGSLAGLIDMVADTVRQRQQFARKIKGLTAMGRVSAYVLIALPFFIAIIITVLNPRVHGAALPHVHGPQADRHGLAMMGFGTVVLRKNRLFQGVIDAAALPRSRLPRRRRLLPRRARDAARPRAGQRSVRRAATYGRFRVRTGLERESLRDRRARAALAVARRAGAPAQPADELGLRRAEAPGGRARQKVTPTGVPRRQGHLLAVRRRPRAGADRLAAGTSGLAVRALPRRWSASSAPTTSSASMRAAAQRADPRRAARRARPARRQRRGRARARRRHLEADRAHGGPAGRGVRADAVGDADRREPLRGAQAARPSAPTRPRSRPSPARSSRPTSSAPRSAGSCASRRPTRGCAARQPPRSGR